MPGPQRGSPILDSVHANWPASRAHPLGLRPVALIPFVGFLAVVASAFALMLWVADLDAFRLTIPAAFPKANAAVALLLAAGHCCSPTAGIPQVGGVTLPR